MRAKKLNIYEKTLFKSKKVYFDYYFLIYIYIITQTHIIYIYTYIFKIKIIKK